MKALSCWLAVMTTLVVAGTADGVDRGASSFHLVFDGRHTPDLLHEGPFTTSLAACPSGSAADVQVDDVSRTVVRRFACTGSADDFTARITPFPAEHGGNGTWQIVAGSGALADLRGMGTWASVRLDGNSADPFTITFRSTWDGVADLDVSAPTIALTSARARKVVRPKGRYQLRIAMSLLDSAGNAVSYRLTVFDPKRPFDLLGTKSGQTSVGSALAVVRVRPAKRTRVLRLKIEATDPVGNASALARLLRLP